MRKNTWHRHPKILFSITAPLSKDPHSKISTLANKTSKMTLSSFHERLSTISRPPPNPFAPPPNIDQISLIKYRHFLALSFHVSWIVPISGSGAANQIWPWIVTSMPSISQSNETGGVMGVVIGGIVLDWNFEWLLRTLIDWWIWIEFECLLWNNV